jgi:hypothetical protein
MISIISGIIRNVSKSTQWLDTTTINLKQTPDTDADVILETPFPKSNTIVYSSSRLGRLIAHSLGLTGSPM